MKKLIVSISVLLAYAASTAQDKVAATAMLIPAPVEVFPGQGSFSISRHTAIGRQDDFQLNGINKVRLKTGHVSGRYIKVIGINKGIIPAGGYGAGANSLLMIDELIVN